MPERIGILAFQGDVREHAQIVSGLGAQAESVRRPEDLASLDALIIPGGESTTIDKLSRSFGLADPLREKITQGFPVYGSCAGMVMLADTIADPQLDASGNPQRSFGGIDMVVARNAFGRQIDSFEAETVISGIRNAAEPFPAVFIRAPWALNVGEGVEILGRIRLPLSAKAPAGEGPAVAMRQGNLLATSFHPEVTADHRIHELFLSIIRKEV